jgi:hypothetical protein
MVDSDVVAIGKLLVIRGISSCTFKQHYPLKGHYLPVYDSEDIGFGEDGHGSRCSRNI